MRAPETAQPVATRALAWPGAPSVELALFAVLTVAGACLRLVGLGARPLGPDEMGVAVAALEGGAFGASVLLQHGAAWSMALFGATEAAARLVPALAGACLAPAAWGLRRSLGAGPALGVAAVLAISPMWVWQSRVLEAHSLSLLCLLLLVGCLSAGRIRLAAVAAALALVSGGVVWMAIAAALLAAPLAWALGGGEGEREGEGAVGALRALRAAPRDAGLAAGLFLSTLVLAATGLTHLDGLVALGAAPGAWVAELGRDRVDLWHGAVLPLLVHAPELMLLGLAGLWIGPQRPLRIVLAIWLGLTLALALALVVASPWAAAQVLTPLALSAGVALAALASALARGFRWTEDGVMAWILLVVLGYALLHAMRYAHAGPVVGQRDDWALMSGSLAMAAVLILAFAVLWGLSTALRVGGLVGALFCLGLASANAVALDRLGTPEIWRPRRTTPASEALAQLVAGADAVGGGEPVLVDARLRPELAWPLRHVDGVAWTAAEAMTGTQAAAWVGPAGSPEIEAVPGAGAGNAGSIARTFSIARSWRPGFAERQGFLRWYLQRAILGDATYRPVFPDLPRDVIVVLPIGDETAMAAFDPSRAAAHVLVEGWR